jgi:hypothetical protein
MTQYLTRRPESMYSVTQMAVAGLRTLRTPFRWEEAVGTEDEHRRRVCDPSVARRCVEPGVRATQTGALGLLGSRDGRGAVRNGDGRTQSLVAFAANVKRTGETVLSLVAFSSVHRGVAPSRPPMRLLRPLAPGLPFRKVGDLTPFSVPGAMRA